MKDQTLFAQTPLPGNTKTMGNLNTIIGTKDRHAQNLLGGILSTKGCSVTVFPALKGLRENLENQEIDLLILDLDLVADTGASPISLIRQLSDAKLLPATLLLASSPNVSLVVEAMQLGVWNVLTRPLATQQSQDTIQTILEAIDSDLHSKLEPNRSREKTLKKNTMQSKLIGGSAPAQELRRIVETVARVDATVLITGETGVGKEIVAREIHKFSLREKGPCITVNCAAIPEPLLESELFGHTKGAFTGAIGSRKGKFSQAQNGTLFLDEIGEMPLALQPKLLRVIQERLVEAVGSIRPSPIDCRFIAATNRNLEELATTGEFRADLYYRLNVVPIHVPALRDRSDDIPELVQFFLSKFNKEFSHKTEMPTDSAMHLLIQHAWPGNIRELEHVVQRLVILYPESVIDDQNLRNTFRPDQSVRISSSLPTPNTLPSSGINLRKTLESYERTLIFEALGRTRGNKKQAASLLGLNRTTLVEKIKRYQNSDDGFSTNFNAAQPTA